MEINGRVLAGVYVWIIIMMVGVKAWTGEINGRVVCDVCGDASIGPEDHVLQGLHFTNSPFSHPIFHVFVFLYMIYYGLVHLLWCSIFFKLDQSNLKVPKGS